MLSAAAPSATTLPGLAVDVVSDVVCPWCYIGKRRLEQALSKLREQEPALAPRVRWHPFQLDPTVPSGGVDRRAYREAKFGSAARVAEIHARVEAAGRSVGLAFAFDVITRQPNTLDAHRLIAWAQAQDGAPDVDALVERLFHAFFVEGRDVGDRTELARIAAESGGDPVAARALLDSNLLAAEIAAANERAHTLGIGGVPFIIFDGSVAVSGAQEPDVLLDAIATARERG